MSARAGSVKRRRRGATPEGGDNEERWLLTYADMITLLMALFMVLFSIANVNKAKLESLSKSLNEAFSGKILTGGRTIKETGADTKIARPVPEPPIPAITPLVNTASQILAKAAARQEQNEFAKIKQNIDSYARAHGLQSKIQSTISQRGLVIRLLTDKVLFDSGQAQLKPQAGPILSQVARLLRLAGGHDVMVEGHTDNVPIRGSLYPTNWELSTARASRVVRALAQDGAATGHLGAAGYAALHPLTSNVTPAGRSRNRRVEVVLLRSKEGAAVEQGGSTP